MAQANQMDSSRSDRSPEYHPRRLARTNEVYFVHIADSALVCHVTSNNLVHERTIFTLSHAPFSHKGKGVNQAVSRLRDSLFAVRS